MKPNTRKRASRFGEVIGRVYKVYFPRDGDHHGGTDADHIPVIPGNDFTPAANNWDEIPLPHPTPGDGTCSGEQSSSSS